MPRAIPLTGMNRMRRWATIGALIGLCILVAGVALNFIPQAQWVGRGIFTNLGLIGGALIGGGFAGALAALAVHTARSN